MVLLFVELFVIHLSDLVLEGLEAGILQGRGLVGVAELELYFLLEFLGMFTLGGTSLDRDGDPRWLFGDDGRLVLDYLLLDLDPVH